MHLITRPLRRTDRGHRNQNNGPQPLSHTKMIWIIIYKQDTFTIGDRYQFKVKRGQIQQNFTVEFDDRVGFHAFKSENFSDNWHWKLRLIFSAQRDWPIV